MSNRSFPPVLPVRNNQSFTKADATDSYALVPLVDQGPDNRSQSRFDHLEGRLSQQEKTTQVLLDRAYRIKEEVLETLNFTHGTWQEEKRGRELLQDHIKTITDVVRKLGRDIQIVEEEIKKRENITVGAAQAVKTLETHHIAGITDLRGRVARCDASTAKIATDLKACFETVHSLGSSQSEVQNRSAERIQTLETKLAEVQSRIDKFYLENESKLRMVEGESSSHLVALDNKTRTMIDETRSVINTTKLVEETEREKLEARLTGIIERSMIAQDAKLEKLDVKLEEFKAEMQRRMGNLSSEIHLERDRIKNICNSHESKLHAELENRLKRQNEEIAKLKHICREGFSSVQESIDSIKKLTDDKRKLLEEQLRKEIGQIRKMVVLI